MDYAELLNSNAEDITINSEDLNYFVGGFIGGGLDHPEGIASGKDGEAYAGGEEGQVYKIDTKERTFTQIASTGAVVGGLAQDGNGNIYCCCGPDVVRVTQNGDTSSYPNNKQSMLQLANYPVFDKNGNLYVSDSGGWKKDDGKIIILRQYRFAVSRRILEFPAGILSERFGERRLLVLGLIGVGIGYLALSFIGGYQGVLLALFVAGCGAAFQHSLCSSMISQSFREFEHRIALE